MKITQATNTVAIDRVSIYTLLFTAYDNVYSEGIYVLCLDKIE